MTKAGMRFALGVVLTMAAPFLFVSAAYWWGIFRFNNIGDNLPTAHSGVVIGLHQSDVIGGLRWFEKRPGDPWRVAYVFSNTSRWDRKIAVAKVRYLSPYYVPFGKVTRIKLAPCEMRFYVLEGEGAESCSLHLGIFSAKPTGHSLIGTMGGCDVKREVAPYTEALEAGDEETLRVQCGREACWRAEKFIWEAGDQIEMTCYLINPEKIEVQTRPGVRMELSDSGGARATKHGQSIVLDYGVTSEGELDSFRVALKVPLSSEIEGFWVLADGRNESQYVRAWVMPPELYRKTFLDKVASLTVANIPPAPWSVIEIGDGLLLVFGVFYLGRFVRKKIRKRR